MHGEARRHMMAMVAAGAMLVLLVLAMVSAITVAADSQPTGDNSDFKANHRVREGVDATRYVQPLTPTQPPLAGRQNDHTLRDR